MFLTKLDHWMPPGWMHGAVAPSEPPSTRHWPEAKFTQTIVRAYSICNRYKKSAQYINCCRYLNFEPELQLVWIYCLFY